MDDPLGALAGILEEAGIEYALIGGHAVNAWVEPRFTADIDLTIEAGVAQMRQLASTCSPLFRSAVETELCEAEGPPGSRRSCVLPTCW